MRKHRRVLVFWWLLFTGVIIAGCSRFERVSPTPTSEEPASSKVSSPQSTPDDYADILPPYALSPDGKWLLAYRAKRVKRNGSVRPDESFESRRKPPVLINVASTRTFQLSDPELLAVAAAGWSWHPASHGFIFPTRSDGFIFCSVPEGKCTLIDFSSADEYSPLSPVRLTYISATQFLVLMFDHTGQQPPCFAFMELQNGALSLTGDLMTLPIGTDGTPVLTPYTKPSGNFAIASAFSVTDQRNIVWSVPLAGGQPVVLLDDEKVATLTGATKAEFMGPGDPAPALGGKWAFALLSDYDKRYPNTFVRLRLDDGTAEKVVPMPRAQGTITASTDGLQLAYSELVASSDEYVTDAPSRIVVCDQNAENKRYLTDGRHNDHTPIWNDATDEVIFARGVDRICAVPISGGEIRTLISW